MMARVAVFFRAAALWALLLALFPSPRASSAHAGETLVFALCYHSFLGSARYAGDVSPAELAGQLDELSSRGFRFVTLSDIDAGRLRGTRNVLVTIDDGNASVYDAYFSVFRPRGIRPLLCIYPGVIGRKSYSLTWERLARLVQDGCEVASHGYYHLGLTSALFEEDRQAFEHEIFGSRKKLEERLGVRVRSFAYPSGVHSPQARRLLAEAGYSYAFTILWGPVRLPGDLDGSRLTLPRYMIYRGNWPVVLGAVSKCASGASAQPAATRAPSGR